jgi:hypothetical protein
MTTAEDGLIWHMICFFHLKIMNTLSKHALGALLAAGISYNANATFSLTLHNEFSGGTQPLGNVQLDFTTIAAGTVDLKITSLLSGTEALTQLNLNLDPGPPALDPTQLSFALQSSTGTFGAIGISTGVNAFKADGDGLYDIEFDLPPPGTVFDQTDTVTYRITGIASLTENSFNFLSAPDGGHGPFVAAAHIQRIGPNDGSGWIAPGVPDGGTTIMLLGGAFACLGAFRRRLA